MAPISPVKTLALALTALTTTTPVLALVTVPFTSYTEPGCTGRALGSAHVVATYCVNIEDFPIRSFSAYVSEGTCEGEGHTPRLRLFGEAGCKQGEVLEEVKVDSGEEGACFGLEGTVRSLEVVCA